MNNNGQMHAAAAEAMWKNIHGRAMTVSDAGAMLYLDNSTSTPAGPSHHQRYYHGTPDTGHAQAPPTATRPRRNAARRMLDDDDDDEEEAGVQSIGVRGAVLDARGRRQAPAPAEALSQPLGDFEPLETLDEDDVDHLFGARAGRRVRRRLERASEHVQAGKVPRMQAGKVPRKQARGGSSFISAEAAASDDDGKSSSDSDDSEVNSSGDLGNFVVSDHDSDSESISPSVSNSD